jgi:hypothetical protein
MVDQNKFVPLSITTEGKRRMKRFFETFNPGGVLSFLDINVRVGIFFQKIPVSSRLK